MKKLAGFPFFALTAALLAFVAASGAEFWRRDARALFFITAGYVGYEIAVQTLLVTAAALGLKKRRRVKAYDRDEAEPMTILIAAHNEKSCIVETLESIFAQDAADLRVIVASDGSQDGMNEMLVSRYGLQNEGAGRFSSDWLLLLTLPKIGKGAALNAALAEADTDLIATLDADTRLAPGAITALANAFREPRTVSAGGFIYVRNARRGPWLVRYQYWEYLKNFIWRIGLEHLGVCLQVSGAFGAFRTQVLRDIGGFSERSLVEDYEVIYRLHERMQLARADYRVDVVPTAVAFTESPETIPSFVHQRTRWFAGFLQTLWTYRRMVGNPKMGALGWLMLPIKCVDAILPLWGATSLLLLLAASLFGATQWRWASLELFGLRWAGEIALSILLCRWARRLSGDKRGDLHGARLAFCIVTEGLLFNWFRQIAVLNAYGWFIRRVQHWRQPRWTAVNTKPA